MPLLTTGRWRSCWLWRARESASFGLFRNRRSRRAHEASVRLLDESRQTAGICAGGGSRGGNTAAAGNGSDSRAGRKRKDVRGERRFEGGLLFAVRRRTRFCGRFGPGGGCAGRRTWGV